VQVVVEMIMVDTLAVVAEVVDIKQQQVFQLQVAQH
jgi:hypothetical protein